MLLQTWFYRLQVKGALTSSIVHSCCLLHWVEITLQLTKLCSFLHEFNFFRYLRLHSPSSMQVPPPSSNQTPTHLPQPLQQWSHSLPNFSDPKTHFSTSHGLKHRRPHFPPRGRVLRFHPRNHREGLVRARLRRTPKHWPHYSFRQRRTEFEGFGLNWVRRLCWYLSGFNSLCVCCSW